MNKVIPAVIVAVCVVVVAWVLILKDSPDAEENNARADQALQAQRLDLLRNRVESMRQELQESADRIRGLEDRLAGLTALAVPAATATNGSAELNSRPDGAAKSAKKMKALPVALGSGDEADSLRQFVLNVVDEERKMRADERTRMVKERRREREEMQKGPFGKHNYKVNSMGKKLALTELQKQRYYELLTTYSDRIQETRKGIDWKNRTARNQFQTQRKEIGALFTNDVKQMLSPTQAETFDGIPAWERNLEGGASVVWSSALSEGSAGYDLDVGGIVTELHVAEDTAVQSALIDVSVSSDSVDVSPPERSKSEAP